MLDSEHRRAYDPVFSSTVSRRRSDLDKFLDPCRGCQQLLWLIYSSSRASNVHGIIKSTKEIPATAYHIRSACIYVRYHSLDSFCAPTATCADTNCCRRTKDASTTSSKLKNGFVLVLSGRWFGPVYTVQPGDTCISVAYKFGVPLSTLFFNNAEQCDDLGVREVLCVALDPIPNSQFGAQKFSAGGRGAQMVI